MDRFIFSWFVMNSYYAAYADDAPNPAWKKKDPTEKEQITHFAGAPIHAAIRSKHNLLFNVKDRKAHLPLLDHKGHNVPTKAAAGEYSAPQLETEDYLRVLYVLRCHFVHGERGRTTPTDQRLLHFAADPTYEYVGLLIRETPLVVRT